MHRAEVNMMVCSKALLNVARKLEEKYGTPWFEGSFYGVADTSQAFRDFARLIGRPRPDRAHRGDDRSRGGPDSRGPRTLAAAAAGQTRPACTPAASSPGRSSRRLQDLGLIVVATGTTKSTEEDKKRIRELMGDEVQMIDDGNPQALLEGRPRVEGRHPDRGRPQHVHGPEGQDSVPGHQPGTRLRLRRVRGNARAGPATGPDHESPVWEAVTRPTPWEPARTRPSSCRRRRLASIALEEALRMTKTTTSSARTKPLSVSPLKASADHRRVARLHGGRPRHAADARRPGMHRVRQGLFRAAFPRADPAANDGDGPDQLGDGSR